MNIITTKKGHVIDLDAHNGLMKLYTFKCSNCNQYDEGNAYKVITWRDDVHMLGNDEWHIDRWDMRNNITIIMQDLCYECASDLRNA